MLSKLFFLKRQKQEPEGPQNLFQFLPDPALFLDPKGTILDMNEACKEAYGYKKTELIRRNIFEAGFIARSSIPKLLREFDFMIAGLPRLPFELDVLRKDAQKRTLESHVRVLKNQNKVEGVVMTFRDVSEKKRLEDQQTEFVSRISHELRTPLTIIKGAVGNMRDGIVGTLTEKQTRVVEAISRNVDRLGRIVGNVLDLSRLESGKANIQIKKVDMTQVIEETILNMGSQARGKGLKITSRHPESLPDVWADPDLMTQVMTNLLSNAIRFAKSHIFVETHEMKHQVEVSVRDDGIGIRREDQALLFNKFEQLSRPLERAEYKGTGLGLSICKEILKNHHGEIWVESDHGKGTRFLFRLSQYDALSVLRKELETMLSRSHTLEEKVGVILISFPNLEEQKRSHGIQPIEKVMQEFEIKAKESVLRRQDLLLENDGEGFFIVLANINPLGLPTILARVQKMMETICANDPAGIRLELNIRTALFPDDGETVDELLTTASRHGEEK